MGSLLRHGIGEDAQHLAQQFFVEGEGSAAGKAGSSLAYGFVPPSCILPPPRRATCCLAS
jgi:hypothetical protein